MTNIKSKNNPRFWCYECGVGARDAREKLCFRYEFVAGMAAPTHKITQPKWQT